MQKDQIDLVLSVVATSLFILLLIVAAILLFRIYLKRKNQLLLERERMSIQFEQTLLQSKLEIQELTFANISSEIHDNIGQVLSLARINLNTLRAPDDLEKLNLVDELMEKAITDLRSLSHSLSADLIRKKGWVEPVQKLLNDLRRSGKYEVQLNLAEGLPPLGQDKPIILFRMIQEAVNNIIRHAAATAISFEASREPERLIISIRDNGKGFIVEEAATGAGLRNLDSRARMINADLHILSGNGNGTTITISVKTND